MFCIFDKPSGSGTKNINKALLDWTSTHESEVFYFMEIWKDIPNYEGKYQVSNLGNVKSLLRKRKNRNGYRLVKDRILKTGFSSGYLMVSLCDSGKMKSTRIHKLVAMAFLNHAPCGYELVVNHINFNKLDNRVENLEIVTNRENTNLKHIASSSKYIGVSWKQSVKKWRAIITANGKQIHIGYFKSEIEASNAYQNALINLT